MARVDFQPNYRELGRILRSTGMRQEMERAAEFGLQYARSISPRITGHYVASFHITSGVGTVITRDGISRRAEALLYNDADYAVDVEWRNGDRILGRTVNVIEKWGK